jgi:endonuclease/exonuclease/phosphatase family metal-dependent hydrolase
MKIMSLNVWGGNVGQKLLDFFEMHKGVDVFLLQEVFHNATDKTAWDEKSKRELFTELQNILNNHIGYFADAEAGEWGLACFVKKDLEVKEYGEKFVYRWKSAMKNKDGTLLGKNIQFFKIDFNGSELAIINFHGLWTGKGKEDTEERIGQSREIITFARNFSDKIIIAGDFNLRPETESLKMLETELNLKNLIRENHIPTTRTSHYKHHQTEKFADYTLVSENIKVRNFQVLPDEISDHCVMLLEI